MKNGLQFAFNDGYILEQVRILLDEDAQGALEFLTQHFNQAWSAWMYIFAYQFVKNAEEAY